MIIYNKKMNNQFGSYFSSGSFTTLPVQQLCQVLQNRDQSVTMQALTPVTIQQFPLQTTPVNQTSHT